MTAAHIAVDATLPKTEPAGTESRGRAIRGWIVAGAVYFAAVFHRTSLGVVGLQAEHRFGIEPGQLSVFVLVQLGVYAAMQIPTGVLVDRYGPRRLLLAAAMTMALAQLLFAVAPSYPVALLARAALGCGDAMTFVSVLRYAVHRFTPRQYPMVVAATTIFGSVGNIAATLPLTIALRHVGWFPTFAGAGAFSVLTGVAVWLVLPDVAPRPQSRRSLRDLRAPLAQVGGRVARAWTTPGTRLGFWVHFSCMSTTTTFGVLWGTPYLVAQGYSASAASSVLLVSVLVALLVSPPIGAAFGRFPYARVPFALASCLAAIAGWATLLIGFGGRPPHPLVLLVVAITAIGGPASAIGFALARDYNTRTVVGTSTGVVNVGGFVAAICASLAIGGVLDLTGSSDAAAFRIAFAIALLVQIGGTVQVVRWWLRLRTHLLRAQARGDDVPVPVVRRRFDRVGS